MPDEPCGGPDEVMKGDMNIAAVAAINVLVGTNIASDITDPRKSVSTLG